MTDPVTCADGHSYQVKAEPRPYPFTLTPTLALALTQAGIYQLFQLSPQLTGLTLLVVPPIALLATVARRFERGMSRKASAAGALLTVAIRPRTCSMLQ